MKGVEQECDPSTPEDEASLCFLDVDSDEECDSPRSAFEILRRVTHGGTNREWYAESDTFEVDCDGQSTNANRDELRKDSEDEALEPEDMEFWDCIEPDDQELEQHGVASLRRSFCYECGPGAIAWKGSGARVKVKVTSGRPEV